MSHRGTGVGRWALRGYGALVYLFLYLPIAIVVLYSFNAGRLFLWPPSGFSLHWYRALASDPITLQSLRTSLQVASAATLVSVAIGTLGAIALNRSEFRGRRIIQALVFLPLVVPGLVLGLGLLLVFTSLSVRLSKITVVAGHVAFITPVVLFVVSSRLQRLSPRLELAARDLGAGRWRALWYVTLPLIKTAMIGGALLALTLSLDEVILSFLLTGVDNTLPVQIYSLVRFGVTPEVNAVYTLILVLTIAVVLVSLRFTQRR